MLMMSIPAIIWGWAGIASACLLLGACDWLGSRHRRHSHSTENTNEGVVSMNATDERDRPPDDDDDDDEDPSATIPMPASRPRICNGDEPTTMMPAIGTMAIRREDMDHYEAFCAGLEAAAQYTPAERIALYRVAIRAGRQAEGAGGPP